MTDIQNIIKSKYGAVAENTMSNRDAGVQAVAEAFGYSAEELASIPAEANMGFRCQQAGIDQTRSNLSSLC